MRGLIAFGDTLPDRTPRAAVEDVRALSLPLEPADRAIVDFAARVTIWPGSVRPVHLEPLRQSGLDDRGIHDVVHVACCFAYMNRLVDALGVAAEPRKQELAVELYGADRLAEHLAWSLPDDTVAAGDE